MKGFWRVWNSAVILHPQAQMAELVDASDSKSGTRKGVQVRFLFWAQTPFQRSWKGVFLCERRKLAFGSERRKTPTHDEGMGGRLGKPLVEVSRNTVCIPVLCERRKLAFGSERRKTPTHDEGMGRRLGKSLVEVSRNTVCIPVLGTNSHPINLEGSFLNSVRDWN